jgi:porphobilinogen synthase
MIWPAFVVPGDQIREPIESMPGQERLSIDQLLLDAAQLVERGIGGILLFGLAGAHEKDSCGSAAFSDEGIVQQAVRALKQAYPDFLVIADVCVCAYTHHGHCGPLTDDGEVANDLALESLSKTAHSMAVAGADIVAPSAMMDGQVQAIRTALDDAGFTQTLILSYSTKFASALYGPFRDAEKSSPQEGDRQGYQADYTDAKTARRESVFDEVEGADMLMIKPALFYLDILSQMRAATDLPIAAYHVSGEYAMIHATAEKGWGEVKALARESTVAMVRAGADILITYWANQYDEIFRDD